MALAGRIGALLPRHPNEDWIETESLEIGSKCKANHQPDAVNLTNQEIHFYEQLLEGISCAGTPPCSSHSE